MEPSQAAACRDCGTALPAGARFCTECGTATGTRPRRTTPAAIRDQTPRLVECDACGAGNAASRPLCARCGSPLRDEVPGGDALPESAHQPPPPPVNRRPKGGDSPPVLLSLVVLAGLITAGVLLSLVTSRVTTPDVTAVPAGVALQAASASTAQEGHAASLAIDGDPTTAWTEGAPGEGEEEWIEVTLGSTASVGRLLIWNGDQGSEVRWTENGWASVIRIEVGDRQFRVRLRNVLGPQTIDLPDAVTTDRVRIVVEQAEPGTRYSDLAISEVVLESG